MNSLDSPERKQEIDKRLSSSKARVRSRTALQAVSDGVIVTNSAGRIEFINNAAEALSGWTLQDAANKSVDDIIELREEESGELLTQTGVWQPAELDALDMGRCTLRTRDGRDYSIDANVSPVVDDLGSVTGSVLILKDRRQETGLRKRLAHQASHDALTGCLNRSAFEQALAELADQKIKTTNEFAVIYLDIDQFKIINDTCGHAAGDNFLVSLAKKLENRVRKSDVLARLSGDEFGILLRGCDAEHAKQFAEELCDLVENVNFVWNGRIYKHTASIGVTAVRPDDDVASILSAADVACFTAKDSGRNRVHVYDDGKVPSRHVEMQWVARISRALDEDRLVIYQQPIVPINESALDEVPHYELLVRITDRFGQIILPKYFIAAAERYNMMPRIDRWMISNVLSKLVWRPQLSPEVAHYKLSVNLSGTSLSDDGFMTHLERELDRYPIEPGTLCFEVTETATISNISDVAQFMHRMKERGCEFSLDDFGSGLSSFAYLKELPVDLLKIDGDFVADVLTSDADAAVVDAISRVGKAMNIKTVAERVETPELLAALKNIGVDYAQGYLFGKPRLVRNRSSLGLVGPTALSNSA